MATARNKAFLTEFLSGPNLKRKIDQLENDNQYIKRSLHSVQKLATLLYKKTRFGNQDRNSSQSITPATTPPLESNSPLEDDDAPLIIDETSTKVLSDPQTSSQSKTQSGFVFLKPATPTKRVRHPASSSSGQQMKGGQVTGVKESTGLTAIIHASITVNGEKKVIRTVIRYPHEVASRMFGPNYPKFIVAPNDQATETSFCHETKSNELVTPNSSTQRTNNTTSVIPLDCFSCSSSSAHPTPFPLVNGGPAFGVSKAKIFIENDSTDGKMIGRVELGDFNKKDAKLMI